MDQFASFLELNINEACSENHSKIFREGVYKSSFLLTDPDCFSDPIYKCRFLYIRNLCLNRPEPFEICEHLSKFERALMFLSFNNISDALEALDTNFACEVIGAKAKTRTGAEINTSVLECRNTISQTRLEYAADGYTYEDFTVQPLQCVELIYCYIKIVDILRNEDNETLKKFKLKAYLNRVLMTENELNAYFLRAFLVMLAEISNSTEELDKIKNTSVQIDEAMFAYPITFKFDVLIQLGLAYKNRRYFKEAYDCLQPYPLYIEKIDCLIGLRRSEEAAGEIGQFITMIGNSNEREDRLMLCDLYIKLAHLYQDPAYFDRAFQAFRCPKPLHLKGLFYFKRKEYDAAIQAFENALLLTPQDEKVRFSYACGLIEADRISEAIKILKELRSENPTNEQIAKNLGYCYYKLNDIDNTLLSLKRVALSDANSMNQFFILSVKNEKVDNIRWALSKISSVDLLKGGVNYLMANGLMSEAELKEMLETNPYVESVDVFGT
ncbi:uncharacterized protein VICG_00992 [Vittaforma corneae ATCC 50505]|uniref:Uncharacterized protein n=1 Tax=Vittaforma corneae (strain ATCC 50505) TaxID=993615 RepID=L2GN97_VITCO|nr:uncharacterized protein VICG_00992 [Vittaforma corneae ATCC 50505]ELA41975.1 hypothetical protein VICG_00992 [Vittaforma corneae ATCC 50505]